MIAKTILHYKILEKLGEGGMGVVYKAEDTKLKRTVALKFLPQDLSRDEESKERFIHEAQAASALDHPNICTIHEIDETEDGQMFIAMACYEGESLREKIKSQDAGLSVNEAVEIAIQVAEGLSKAHKKQILHRDLKPANIMLTSEKVVKIVDFGLAKLAGQTKLTKSGTMMGTASYMSPEQVQGAKVDQRTDIWSFGVVLFEMLTADLPFKGDYQPALTYAIMNEEPPLLANLRKDTSSHLHKIVEKSLQKEPANRYEDMKGLLKDLRSVSKESASEPSLPVRKQEVVPSIAVLPFSNMSADKEQTYFCDGMAEEIINALVKIEGLRVAARTSSFAFKGKHEDIREIGKKLNVDKVLEGSVRKSGKRLRITAQLINIEDGYHLWSERYDRELEDVFEIQDEISLAIVAALKVKLVDRKDKPLIKPPTDNLEAYDAYLRGVYCFNQRKKTENDKAIALFAQATNIDAKFALAFAGLAYAYIEKLFTYQPQKKWEEKAFVALKKALALDPELAEAYVAQGNLLWTKSNHFPHAEAIAEYERAIELKPTLAEAHNELARALWHVGALNRAYSELKRALEIDPTYVDVKFRMGMLKLQRGHFESAFSLLRKIPQEALVEWVDALIALCLFYLDRKDEAFAHIKDLDEALSASPEVISTEAIFLAMEGKEKEVIKKINLATKKGKHFGHFHHVTNNFAAAYAVMNKKKLALDYLEETADDGFPCYPWFEIDPCLENIRKEPRFVKLMERLRNQWEKFEAKV